MAITFSNLGIAEPSTVTHELASVTVARNSSNEFQEILCLGDPETAAGIARVLAATPASTEYGLAVREIAHSTGPFQISSVGGVVAVSTGPGLSRIIDRDQSTQVAAVLNAAPASTVWALAVREVVHSTGPFQISSVGGVVTVSTGPFQISSVGGVVSVSTGPFQISSVGGVVAVSTGPFAVSSIAGRTLVDQNSTTWPVQVSSVAGAVTVRVNTSSGGAVEGSTGTPAAGALGLHVRQVYPTMNSTTVVITSTHSTAIYELISSAAALRHKVYAYFVGSTHTNPSTLIFCSSASASDLNHWAVNFGSGSSGITGANLAIAPPGFLFAGVAANALNVKVEGGSSVTSTVVVRVAISWFDEA